MPSYHAHSDRQGSSDPAGNVIQEIERDRTSNETQEIQREKTSPPAGSPSKGRAAFFKQAVQLPLDDYMIQAYYYNRDNKHNVGWKTSLFHFVWFMRGHPDLHQHHNNAAQAFKVADHYLSSWTKGMKTKKSSPPYGFNSDPWFDWFEVEKAEAKAEFYDVWQKSRYLPGHDPIEQAIIANRKNRLLIRDDIREKRPVSPSSEADERDYEFFIGIAGHLQVAMGNEPIKLPCGKLSEALGLSAMTISRFRRWAIEDRYLTVSKAHKFRSKGVSEATEFFFDVSRYAKLKEKAQPGTIEAFHETPEGTPQ